MCIRDSKRKYLAENGGDGAGKRCTGKKGEDIILRVPQGTVVRDFESGRIIADVSDTDKDYVLARGGKMCIRDRHITV